MTFKRLIHCVVVFRVVETLGFMTALVCMTCRENVREEKHYEIRHESTCFGIVARVQFGCDTPGLSGRRVLRGCGWGTQTRTTHLLKRTSWNLQVPQQVRTIDQCEQMCSLLGGSSGGGDARCRPPRNPVTAAAATLPVVLYRCSIEASIEALRLR